MVKNLREEMGYDFFPILRTQSNNTVEEPNQQLATRNSQTRKLANSQLATRNSQLATRNSQLATRKLATRNSQLATRKLATRKLATRNSQLATRNSQLATRNSQLNQNLFSIKRQYLFFINLHKVFTLFLNCDVLTSFLFVFYCWLRSF